MSRLSAWFGIAVLVALTAAASGETPGAAASSAAPSPQTQSPPAERPARRIVTLAPHLTELVFTVGAGDRLVGVDAYSDYPPEARSIARIGDAFQVDYERLLALRPDLVLVWTTGMPEAVMNRITELGLRVERVSISRLADIAAALEQIGALTGQGVQAHREADAFRARVAALRSNNAALSPVTVFYQISEAPLYTVSGKHVISEMIELCGGRNIFAELEQVAPPVGLEAVIERNPEAIITADGAQGDPLSVWRRWPDVKAVRLGNLYTVSADKVARSTTRIVEGATQICAAIGSARRKAGANRSP